MKTHKHMLVAATICAIGGALPDIFLPFFVTQTEWVEEDNLFLRLHRFNHSRHGLVFWFFVGIISHIVVDFFSEHNTKETWNERQKRNIIIF